VEAVPDELMLGVAQNHVTEEEIVTWLEYHAAQAIQNFARIRTPLICVVAFATNGELKGDVGRP